MERFTSRKFLFSIGVGLLVALNSIFDWKMSYQELADMMNLTKSSLSNKIIRMGLKKPRQNFSDTKFKELLVLGKDVMDKNGWRYFCECDCGNIVSIERQSIGKQRSCGCKKNPRGKDSKLWKGCGDVGGRYFEIVKKGAKDRNLEFNITVEFLWNLFLKQDRKCALSGIELILPTYSKDEQTASLDRIDSYKGYIEDNVQWVHKDINLMKQTLNDDKFINYCIEVAKYQELKKEII